MGEPTVIESTLVVENEPMVCRRVVRSGVVVASLHPVAGPVYWYFVDESDCNAPDHYGVTGDADMAKVFKSGFYRGGSFNSFRSDCLTGLYETDWDDDAESYHTEYDWQVNDLAAKAQCEPEEFVQWLQTTTWVEYPAPLKIYFLEDLNGFLGYRPEWTEDVSDALHWHSSEVDDKDDLDVEIARSVGHFVPLSEASVVKPITRKPSTKNNALEADCALTLHRLGVRVSGKPVMSWIGDLQETAWIYAARAGVEHVHGGGTLPVSGHIQMFPELLERFEMAAALERFTNKALASLAAQVNVPVDDAKEKQPLYES